MKQGEDENIKEQTINFSLTCITNKYYILMIWYCVNFCGCGLKKNVL